jgi:hypothetical protein
MSRRKRHMDEGSEAKRAHEPMCMCERGLHVRVPLQPTLEDVRSMILEID